MSNTAPIAAVAIAAVLSATAPAQTLLQDIQIAASTANLDSSITAFVVAGNQAFFAATNQYGRELWVTDRVGGAVCLCGAKWGVSPGIRGGSAGRYAAVGRILKRAGWARLALTAAWNTYAHNDVLFTKQFCCTLEDAGVQVVRTAIQAPNMNAFAERWVQTVKRECLSKLILFGEGHLRLALSEFTAHYHEQRPHQGIDNKLINPTIGEPPHGNMVVVDERLGGLLRSYRRTA
jgi:hypothetical protein